LGTTDEKLEADLEITTGTCGCIQRELKNGSSAVAPTTALIQQQCSPGERDALSCAGETLTGK
jgi:hypothetical protein